MEWIQIIFWVLIAALLVYTVIPNFIIKILGRGSWKRQGATTVALTFDDGPNPEVTPQLLDVLERNGIIATFFLVGERAERNPEIVTLIRERGHQIGAHSYHHKFAWLMSPWKTWREWEDCNTTLERLIGDEINLVRPPWGTFNLCTWWWMKKHCKQIVLWSAEGHDWQKKRSPEQIIDRITRQITPGGIILLHDAGGDEGAAQHTLQALEGLCRSIHNQKMSLAKLDLNEYK